MVEDLQQNTWDAYLDGVAFSINNNKQKSTKYSPYFLMYGRHPHTVNQVSFKSFSIGVYFSIEGCI